MSRFILLPMIALPEIDLQELKQTFGRGTIRFLKPANRKILAYLRELPGEPTILCVANLSRAPQAVELDLSEFNGSVPIEMTADSVFPAIGQLTYLLTFPPYGFLWFLICPGTQRPTWAQAHSEPLPEFVTSELDPWQEKDEEWRRLHVVWPTYLATHSSEQTIYVDTDGLLRRHDYDVEIQGGGGGAHYISDYTEVAGIMVPTKHRIYPRAPDGQALDEPLLVAIDLSEISFT